MDIRIRRHSNPNKHNDYYTFDYGQHPDIPLGEVRHLGGLRFEGADGMCIQPLYDLQRCRYVVYWKKQPTSNCTINKQTL